MNFQSCEMDARSNAQFWFDVIGNTDDEDSDFEGFTDADLVKIDAADAESDLDLDFEAAQEEFEAEGEDSDGDNEGSSADLLPQLPRVDWSTRLRNVSDGDFKENVGVFHDLEVGAEPLQYFQLLFSGLCVSYDRHRNKSICRGSARRKRGGLKMAPHHNPGNETLHCRQRDDGDTYTSPCGELLVN